MDATRIYGEARDIDEDLVKDFFNARGLNYSAQHPYVSILYQDSYPQLAEKRDQFEKKKILPLLQIDQYSKVLDVGCGIGRWADEIIETVDYYHGIDVSATLIEQAQTRLVAKAKFSVLSASDISEAISCKERTDFNSQTRFNRIIISGVFLYMNDNNVVKTLKGLLKICDRHCLIYIREPLALDDRITLDQYWSNELDSNYSAIYRSQTELYRLIEAGLEGQFSIPDFKMLYEASDLKNRNETDQFFTIIKGE